MYKNRIVIAFSLFLGVVAVLAQAQQPEEILIIEQAVDGDVYAAHRDVSVRSTVNGDVFAAGRRVTVDGTVTGDIVAAAQEIDIRSAVRDDVRAAGQHVRITSPVSGHVVAAGQSVTVEQQVGDWAWLAGNTVEVLGDVAGDLRVRAGTVTINSEVAGDVEVIGDQLNLGPEAIVRGALTLRSENTANINPNAQIVGEFIEEPSPGILEELAEADTYKLPINLIVAVLVLYLLFSRPLRANAERITAHPGWSLLLGLALFCVTPVVAIFLLFTGVGVWLGLALLFTFFVALLLGVATGLFTASDLVVRKFYPQPVLWQSLAAIVVTVVAVGLLTTIPWVGTITVMALWLLGLGALCWNAWAALWTRRDEHEAQQAFELQQT